LLWFDLSFNAFTGYIPDSWWDARSLQSIVIRHNKITGSVSSSVGKLRDLKYLRLGDNQMTGSLPPEIGSLDSVTWIDFARNKFSGEIPASIGNWRHVDTVWMSQNQLEGSIPNTIGDMTSLTELRLDTNPGLTGHLPDALFSLPKLRTLDLYDCSFGGTLPSQIAMLGDSLVALRISGNQFYGSLPVEFANLTEIGQVWLQGNAFTGTVPQSLCNLQSEITETLVDFQADCAPDSEGYTEVICSCCTQCCQPDGESCLSTSSGS